MTLNAVVPIDPSVSSIRRYHPVRLVDRALDLWNCFDIALFGRYSTIRIDRFNAYCENSSLLRVLLVCALMPWPSLLLDILVELIPLQDPKEGWKVNYGAWIRLWIAVFVGSTGVLYQVRVAALGLFNLRIVVISTVIACIATGACVLVSKTWVFPAPFCIFWAGILTTLLLVMVFVFAIFRVTTKHIFGKLLRRKIYLIVVQAFLVLAYVTFSVLYSKCSSSQRFGMLLILPSMKFGLKHLVAWIVSDKKEAIPTAVVFSVDVFNGLYSAVCIQSSGSWWATSMMIFLNASTSVISFLEINESAKELASFTQLKSVSRRSSSNLLKTATSQDSIKVFSERRRSSKTISKPKHNQVVSRILFQLEYHALVGYVESVIPLLFAMHLSILFRLPSARYYPHIKLMTAEQYENTVGNILVYALSEIVALVALHVILKRRFNLSLLYQLAFVLEAEMGLLQARLVMWVVILLQLTLVHFEDVYNVHISLALLFVLRSFGIMPLNVVLPNGPSISNLHDQEVRSRAGRIFKQARILWNYVEISRLGHYSIARINKLGKYCEGTSAARVILICVLMPWPALLLELFCELIPLQDPTLGWEGNYGAWIRLWVAIASGAAGSIFQVRGATLKLSKTKALLITMTTANISTGVAILVSSRWVFPLPFCVFVTGTVAVPIFVVCFLFAVGQRKNDKIGQEIKRKIYLIVVQLLLVVVYTIFSAVFAVSSSILRFGLLLFLPALKLSLKHIVAWIAANDVENIPAVVVFSVDVFNGLYSVICIQVSGSWWTAAVIIVLNILHNILALADINRSAKVYQALSQNKVIRDRSPSLLKTATGPKDMNTKSPQYVKTISKARALTAGILFRLEYRALIAYIKTVIPLLYAIQLSILTWLPSGKYHPLTQNLRPEQIHSVIGSILAYTAIELVSLVWLHITLKQKFDFSLIYQLAFVLDTETELLQGRLFVWIVILLQVTLVHFGMDLTFQFEWIHE